MKALVVIDMQEDFINGPLGTPEARAIVPAVKKKIREYLENGDYIVYTRDTHHSDYLDTLEGTKLPVAHCICGTKGHEILEDLYVDNPEDTFVVDKPTFAAVELLELPDGEDSAGHALCTSDAIEIVGVCTDICVVSNALLLRSCMPNTHITVDAACCAGTTPDNHLAALKVLRSCQCDIINFPGEADYVLQA